MENKNVQEVVDEITRALRETIEEKFVNNPNTEENRATLKELYQKYFEDLTKAVSVAESDFTWDPEPEDN